MLNELCRKKNHFPPFAAPLSKKAEYFQRKLENFLGNVRVYSESQSKVKDRRFPPFWNDGLGVVPPAFFLGGATLRSSIIRIPSYFSDIFAPNWKPHRCVPP